MFGIKEIKMAFFTGLVIPQVSNLISLFDAGNPKTDSSGNINDLVSNNGISWGRYNTVTNDTQNGVACWNMDSGYLETSTRITFGQFYTCFYLWKPRLTDTGWRTMHRNDSDHIGIVQSGAINLGMYSNRNGAFRDSGYDITRDTWQTWILTGSGNSSTDSVGTTAHYVNGSFVGNSDRVGSGTSTYRVGWPGQGPGKIAIAGILNNVSLSASEVSALHRSMYLRV